MEQGPAVEQPGVEQGPAELAVEQGPAVEQPGVEQGPAELAVEQGPAVEQPGVEQGPAELAVEQGPAVEPGPGLVAGSREGPHLSLHVYKALQREGILTKTSRHVKTFTKTKWMQL